MTDSALSSWTSCPIWSAVPGSSATASAPSRFYRPRHARQGSRGRGRSCCAASLPTWRCSPATSSSPVSTSAAAGDPGHGARPAPDRRRRRDRAQLRRGSSPRCALHVGLPALQVEETEAIKTGDRLRVDIEGHKVVNLSSGDRYVIRNIYGEALDVLRAGGMAEYLAAHARPDMSAERAVLYRLAPPAALRDSARDHPRLGFAALERWRSAACSAAAGARRRTDPLLRQQLWGLDVSQPGRPGGRLRQERRAAARVGGARLRLRRARHGHRGGAAGQPAAAPLSLAGRARR